LEAPVSWSVCVYDDSLGVEIPARTTKNIATFTVRNP
jgi:hypothetical protein